MLKGIRNIIFDLGGVIVTIDYNLTRDAFIALGLKDFDQRYSQFSQGRIFDRYEKGDCSPEDFFREIESWLPYTVSRDKIEHAWNAMLLELRPEKLRLLEQLKTRYRTFLFSNTNEGHLRYYFGRLKEWYGLENLDSFFERAYYSHILRMRKPDSEAFLHILRSNGLNPAKTLFIDDSPQHVEGARQTGIRAYLLAKPETLEDFFRKYDPDYPAATAFPESEIRG
jgi:putative hydrolase of the HAD superfamily